ncbi:MAG: type VI secretion system membrane subunit TssM [Acetobacteraceae bacterium]
MVATALRWFLSFVGVQLLCGIVWFLGPLVAGFEEWLPRAAVIAALAVAWAIGNLVLDLRRLSRERALVTGVAGGQAEAAEAAAVRDKLAAAMGLLRKSGGKRGALYEQPWYAIIGPPGAGKTTALLNAGLTFPLAAQMGRGALAGVGGTRLCEWWFTEQAVLIDTAGRYTTQDSDAAVDKAGWDAFLGLLRRTRPQQPLNGVIVAIALTDVVAEGGERLAHARAIRSRVAELESRLGVPIPVYAVFTKVDLLAGFMEFFGDFDREQREQVWGVTFPYRRGVATAVEAFGSGFKRLAGTLERRMFARLNGEANADRRALVAGFPAQFATVGGPVVEFLDAAFAPLQGSAPLLRGVYLTSATQEGAPIDRLTAALARVFGLDQRQAPRLRPEEGRTFFLTGLLRDVIFREAMLVAARPGARRRAMLLRGAGFAACLAVVLAAAGLLWRERAGAQAALETEQAALSGYEQAAGALPLDPVRDADLSGLAPLLDRARALPFGFERAQAPGPGWLGLSQDGKLGAAARDVYRHALAYALFPRLVWRLEAQMRGNLTQPDFMYEATRVYLMLGGAGPLDRDLVREWVSLDWGETYPGAGNAALRAGLLRHLDALLDTPLPSIALDGELVAAARATFGRVSVAQRVYSRIKPGAEASRLAPWRPSDALGAAGVRVFVRSSGRPLTEGVPGFYTAAGFRTVLLPSLGRAVQDVAAESWVLGDKAGLGPDSPAMRSAEQDVVKLYLADYAQVWDAMLADLDVAPLRSLTQAAQDLFILASANSPMRAVLVSAAQQLGLAEAGPGPAGVGRLGSVLGRAAEVVQSPGHEIDERYAGLRELMRPGALDQVLKPLVDLQQQLAKMAASANRAGATPDPGSADPAVALRAEALRQPQPLARWLNSIAASGLALRGGGARQQITAAFNAGGGPAALCPVVVGGKYPFTAGAANEATLEEFARLFAPGGTLDAFFNTQLKPYVDTSVRPWRLQSVEGVSAPIGPGDLLQFQRAAAIRDLFFAQGGTAPRLRFDLMPTGMDAGASAVTLELGSATLTGSGGPPRPAQISWPPSKPGAVRLSWTPPANGSPGLMDQGSWALFRLMGRARMTPAGGDRASVVWRDGERSATFELRAAPNPFGSTLLQEFRCPLLQ